MAPKQVKSLELHYTNKTMVQFLIMVDIPWPLRQSQLFILSHDPIFNSLLTQYFESYRYSFITCFDFSITPRKYDVVQNINSTSNKKAIDAKCAKEHEPDSEESTSIKRAGVGTTLFERQTRISLTLRRIRHASCNCAFPSQCDSQKVNKSKSQVPPSSDVPESEEEAEKLEKLHVHEVYEKIAPHFSGTRHSPWPRIAEFLRDQPVGSLMADVGCGNGKYLGINNSIFSTGSDRSFNLAAICGERGFSVIVCDILSLPYR